jgi:hypothetical protein
VARNESKWRALPSRATSAKQCGRSSGTSLTGEWHVSCRYLFSHDFLYFVSLLAEILRTMGIVLLVSFHPLTLRAAR